MECKFVVGQKVVCIADQWFPAHWALLPLVMPVKGKIYTIDRIQVFFGLPLLSLREISDGSIFHYVGFRPLQDRPKEADTDISVFTPLLNTKELVKEPAQ